MQREIYAFLTQNLTCTVDWTFLSVYVHMNGVLVKPAPYDVHKIKGHICTTYSLFLIMGQFGNKKSQSRICSPAQRSILNFAPRGKLGPPGVKLSPRSELCPLGLKLSPRGEIQCPQVNSYGITVESVHPWG
jgi:hypothetical protein